MGDPLCSQMPNSLSNTGEKSLFPGNTRKAKKEVHRRKRCIKSRGRWPPKVELLIKLKITMRIKKKIKKSK